MNFQVLLDLAATTGAWRTADGLEVVATLTITGQVHVRRTGEPPLQYTPDGWLRAFHQLTGRRRISQLTTRVPA